VTHIVSGMSSSRLPYDAMAYAQTLRQSVGSVDYVLGTPWRECKPCLSRDSGHASGQGVSVCKSKSLVDINSDLMGISRRSSKYCGDKFNPQVNACQMVSQVVMCPEGTLSEDTRMSNPPGTLRSTGFNRWEWLCQNPQDRVHIPFDFMINSQLILKDSHRPVIPTPFDPSPALPNENTPPHESIRNTYHDAKAAFNLPLVSWQSCKNIEKY
jgi:hypothetical protein